MSKGELFDPALYLVLLDPRQNLPIIFRTAEDEAYIIGLAPNGRISFLPTDLEMVPEGKKRQKANIPILDSFAERIEEKFPNSKDENGNPIVQMVIAAISYKDEHKKAFIFDVWGFRETFPELNEIFRHLLSICGGKIGDRNYQKTVRYLATPTVIEWINELIGFLKEEIDWPSFVKEKIDSIE